MRPGREVAVRTDAQRFLFHASQPAMNGGAADACERRQALVEQLCHVLSLPIFFSAARMSFYHNRWLLVVF